MFVLIDSVSEACPCSAPNATTLSCSLWWEDVSKPALQCPGMSFYNLMKMNSLYFLNTACMISILVYRHLLNYTFFFYLHTWISGFSGLQDRWHGLPCSIVSYLSSLLIFKNLNSAWSSGFLLSLSLILLLSFSCYIVTVLHNFTITLIFLQLTFSLYIEELLYPSLFCISTEFPYYIDLPVS